MILKMTREIENMDAAINQGVRFLAEHQFHHGEFCLYIGEGEYLEKWCIPDSSTFATAAICTALLPLQDDPAVNTIFQKAAGFLKYHMMRGGAWNYFTNWHKFFKICPADMDSTVCISYFLKQVGYPFPENHALILANRNKEGLFYTWFTFRMNDLVKRKKSITHWKLLLRGFKHPLKSFLFWAKTSAKKNDIDGAVNANVLFYLGRTSQTEATVRYLIKVIEDHRESECDKWYRNIFELYYAIGRAYVAGTAALSCVGSSIIGRIAAMAQPDGSIGQSPVDTAMAVSALIHFNYSGDLLENGIGYLIKTQALNGSWPRQALCFSHPSIVWGSEELSTALCVEALARFKALAPERNDVEGSLACGSTVNWYV